MDKKFIVIASGIGDRLLSENSKGKLKNSKPFLGQVQRVLNHLSKSKNSYGVINMHYPSDSFNEVDVFTGYKPDTRVVSFKLNAKSLMDKSNEIAIKDHDKDTIRFNGDDFDFLFRPEEYEIYLMGIDLHGIFQAVIRELLDKGYTIKLFSDCLSSLPATHNFISSVQKEKNFEFCSYKTVH